MTSASTRVKFDREPYLRFLPAVTGVNHSVLFAGFNPARFTDANGDIIKRPDGTDFYRAPHAYRITAALENAASKLDANQWAKLCKNDSETLETLVDAAKQTYHAESDIPMSCRSRKPFNVRDAKLILMVERRPPGDDPRYAGSFRSAMSFKPTVTLFAQTNEDETRPTKGLAEIWVQLDGTVVPTASGSPDRSLCLREPALGTFAKQLSQMIPGIFRDQLHSFATDVSAAQIADTAKQIGNFVEAHFEFMTGWEGRNGHFEARGSELPPCWESKGLAIPISSAPVSLQVEARFDGCPRAVEDRATGTGTRVAIGESSAVIVGDGAATSDHKRPFMPSAVPFYTF
jgi:hypothetical protein